MSVLRLQTYVGAMECVQTQWVLTRAVVRKAMRGISNSAKVNTRGRHRKRGRELGEGEGKEGERAS